MSGWGDQSESIARGLIVLLVGAALVAMALIVGDHDASAGNSVGSRVLQTAVCFALFVLPAWAGVNLVQRRPQLLVVGALTVIVAIAAGVAIPVTLWSEDIFGGGDSWQTVGILIVISIAAGQASLLLAYASDADSEAVIGVRWMTLAAIAVLAGLTIDEISSPGSDVGVKPLALAALLYLLGSALVPLLKRTT